MTLDQFKAGRCVSAPGVTGETFLFRVAPPFGCGTAWRFICTKASGDFTTTMSPIDEDKIADRLAHLLGIDGAKPGVWP